jgi:hypothetical protein
VNRVRIPASVRLRGRSPLLGDRGTSLQRGDRGRSLRGDRGKVNMVFA